MISSKLRNKLATHLTLITSWFCLYTDTSETSFRNPS
jgi:hypothetical protein